MTWGHPLKANSSSSSSILSFSSLCAWTICFSRNCTWAKWDVNARSDEFSCSCSPSRFRSLDTKSVSPHDTEPGCVPRFHCSSSGLATAPTGAQRSPAPAKAASLSEVDRSSVDMTDSWGRQPGCLLPKTTSTNLINAQLFNVNSEYTQPLL